MLRFIQARQRYKPEKSTAVKACYVVNLKRSIDQ